MNTLKIKIPILTNKQLIIIIKSTKIENKNIFYYLKNYIKTNLRILIKTKIKNNYFEINTFRII
jgi:hypothetical protein